jgi:hypothetical protein
MAIVYIVIASAYHTPSLGNVRQRELDANGWGGGGDRSG